MSLPAAVALPFAIEGELREAAPLGRGHIHGTWLARFATAAGERRYVLQELNETVFPDLPAVMGNIARVAEHLDAAWAARGVRDRERRALRPVPTRDGALFHRDAGGRAWRAFPFLEGTRSLVFPDGPARAEAAARAFGEFAALLADLPPPPLAVTLADFHDLAKRGLALEAAHARDPHGRAGEAQPLLEACRLWLARLGSELTEHGAAGAPRRTVHNDAKLDNVLFDASSGEALCVVDLDTVMEGQLLFDFGELARSCACPFAEDEADLARLRLDGATLDALARGYRAGAGALLTPGEAALLPLAGPVMALENAVRFLADHLLGDVYFRVARPGHNRVRCRAQLRRVELLYEARDRVARALR